MSTTRRCRCYPSHQRGRCASIYWSLSLVDLKSNHYTYSIRNMNKLNDKHYMVVYSTLSADSGLFVRPTCNFKYDIDIFVVRETCQNLLMLSWINLVGATVFDIYYHQITRIAGTCNLFTCYLTDCKPSQLLIHIASALLPHDQIKSSNSHQDS